MSDVKLIPVSKGGDYLEVHPTTLASHKAAGWKECEQRKHEAPAKAGRKSQQAEAE